MLVVEFAVTLYRGLQVIVRAEACSRENVADTAIEPLHHAIGLGLARLDQAMFRAKQNTLAVEGVLAGRLLAFTGEPVGELAAVVGQ